MSYCEVIEGGVSEINWEVAIADVDECGSNTHDELKVLADVEGCACVYALFSPMQCGSVGSIFCSHLVFLQDEITHKQMVNLCSAKMIS